jgi:uncharacterized protein YjiS (DUF1127 family)
MRAVHAERARAARAALTTLTGWIWHAITVGWRAVRRLIVRLVAASTRWRTAVAERRRLRTGMARLRGLSDRELADIGINRSEIHWAAHHGRHRPSPRPRVLAKPAVVAKPVCALEPGAVPQANASVDCGRDDRCAA